MDNEENSTLEYELSNLKYETDILQQKLKECRRILNVEQRTFDGSFRRQFFVENSERHLSRDIKNLRNIQNSVESITFKSLE